MTTITGKLSRFTQKEIDAFFAASRCTLRHRGLVFLVAPRQKAEYSRILVITSRKVGTAPVRNKIRRQFKTLFYENKYYVQEYDCVIIVRKEATSLPFATLQHLLAQAIPATSTPTSEQNSAHKNS